MILYYAMGGGLGHLARAQAFLNNQDSRDFKIITASRHALKIFSSEQLILIPQEFERHPALLTTNLQNIISGSGADAIYIDTFSHGILGELNGIEWAGIELNYVTRRLKWNVYSGKVKRDVSFKNTFLLESPEPEHMTFIGNSSDNILKISLRYPDHDVDPENPLVRKGDRKKWVIIHSGPHEEVNFLLDRAVSDSKQENTKPILYLISQAGEASVHPAITMDLCPAHGYLQFADRIYTACGFNIMNQTRPYRKVHRFFPFKRKYDDQFWRAANAGK